MRSGGVPARRAVVRWAWRLFRREWRQQILVLTLLTVAVAAAVGLAAAAYNLAPVPGEAEFGTANSLLHVRGSRARRAAGQARRRRGVVRRDRRDRPPLGAGAGLDRDRRLPDPGSAGPLRHTDARPARRTVPGGRRRGRRDRLGGRDVRPRHRRRVRPRRRRPDRRRPRREPERPRRRVRAAHAVARRVVGLRVHVRRRVRRARLVVPSARRHAPHRLVERGSRRGRVRRGDRARRLGRRVVPRVARRRGRASSSSPSVASVSWECSPRSERPSGTCDS